MKWYNVVRNGVAYSESQAYRDEQKRLAQEEKERQRRRETLNIDLDDVEGNANKLLEMLNQVYTFDDPKYKPDIIFKEAGDRFGFEFIYVGKLINNLCDRQLVYCEYDTDPNLHPRDMLDFWRLTKTSPAPKS